MICFDVLISRWDNGEAEQMNPWDLELIDENGEYNEHCVIQTSSVCNINKLMY